MWQKKYQEIKAEWEEVDEESVERTLGSSFHRPKDVMRDMKRHPRMVMRTNFCLFRYVEDKQEPENKSDKNKIINKIQELGYGCPTDFWELSVEQLQNMYDELSEANINLEVSDDLIKLQNIVEKYTG